MSSSLKLSNLLLFTLGASNYLPFFQVTSKQLLKLWENMRRKYKPEIQAKLAQCSDVTMEDEIDVMLSVLSEGDYSNISFNGDGWYNLLVLYISLVYTP